MTSDIRELIERLRDENFALAAGHCIHDYGTGLTADEGGTPYCQMKVERDRLREDNDTLNDIIRIHGEEINRLREELAAAQKDAERYRWLRDSPWTDELRRIIQYHSNSRWDAAIDAAMQQEKRDE